MRVYNELIQLAAQMFYSEQITNTHNFLNEHKESLELKGETSDNLYQPLV